MSSPINKLEESRRSEHNGLMQESSSESTSRADSPRPGSPQPKPPPPALRGGPANQAPTERRSFKTTSTFDQTNPALTIREPRPIDTWRRDVAGTATNSHARRSEDSGCRKIKRNEPETLSSHLKSTSCGGRRGPVQQQLRTVRNQGRETRDRAGHTRSPRPAQSNAEPGGHAVPNALCPYSVRELNRLLR